MRIVGFGVMLFAPLTVLAVGVLLPVNYIVSARRGAWRRAAAGGCGCLPIRGCACWRREACLPPVNCAGGGRAARRVVVSRPLLACLPPNTHAHTRTSPACPQGNFYEAQAANDGVEDHFTTVFVRLTMSNIPPGSRLFW